MEVLDDLARPAHFLRALVANGCSSPSSQEMGRSSTVRGHDILGQTPYLKRRSFCWRVRVDCIQHPMKVTLNGQPCNLIVPVDTHRHGQELEGVVVLYWWDGLATYGEVGGNPLSRRCLDDQGPTLGHLCLQLCPLQPALDHGQ